MEIGLSRESREKVNEVLKKLLADEYLLYTQARNYHWNVTGPHFISYHEFFEKQYDETDEVIDEVAERIRTLGGRALGSLQEMLDHTRLKEVVKDLNASEMLQHLLSNNEAIVRSLREDIEVVGECGDEGTTDFLIALMEKHEKASWFIRSHLE